MGGRPAGTTAARGDGCSSSEPPRLVWSHFAGAAAGRILPERMLPPSEQQRQVAPDAAERTAVVAGSRDRERIRTVVVGEHDDLARLSADRLGTVVARATAERDRCVLGLATGSTPLGIYRELIRRHQAGDLDFARVVTFNLDEYYPMSPDSPHSYHRYMWENLFAHVNIRAENVHLPDGRVPREALAEHCAAAELTRIKTPWLLESVEWTPALTEQAVVWLAEQTGKGILKLTARDYTEHHLSPLLARHGAPGPINGAVFNRLGSKIRGRSKLPSRQRMLVFSPHPDDDVIAMGGTLRKLWENENAIVVAYMTSGNIAVFDHDVRRHLDFVERAAPSLGLDRTAVHRVREAVAGRC